MNELRSSFEQFNLQEKQFQTELSSCISIIAQHKDDLARSDIRYRQLNDNRQLLQSENELKQKQNDLNELEEKTHGLKYLNFFSSFFIPSRFFLLID